MAGVEPGTYSASITRENRSSTNSDASTTESATLNDIKVSTTLTKGNGGYDTYTGWTELSLSNIIWSNGRPGNWGEATKTYGTGKFQATLFPNIDLVSLCGFTEHRWEKYLELRSKVLDIEDSLAEEYFSHELMAVLRHQALATSANESYAWIVARMKPQIVDFIHDKPINHRKMIDIVNFIRNNPEEFPEWHNSDTAKLFSPPKFENKKENKGYWFWKISLFFLHKCNL